MHNKPFVVRTSKNVILIYKDLFEGRYAVEGKVVGTISLIANDILTKPTLTPCITQLFVSEKYRTKFGRIRRTQIARYGLSKSIPLHD